MCLLIFSISINAATNINIAGTIINTSGEPIYDVTVYLAGVPDAVTKTDSKGVFSLVALNIYNAKSSKISPVEFEIKGRDLVVYPILQNLSGKIAVYSGNGRLLTTNNYNDLSSFPLRFNLPSFAPGLNILCIEINNVTYTCPIMQIVNNLYLKRTGLVVNGNIRVSQQKDASIVDTLIAQKNGYVDKKTPVNSYAISDMNITMEPIEQKVCDAKTLKEAGECRSQKILIGTAVSSNSLSNLAAQEFNYVTAENEMKWQYLQGSEGKFTFNQADNIVNWANQRGIKVKGHCLVWHSQLAGWVEQARGRDRVLSIMKKHIETVMEHFGNRVYAWDVVNEAIATDSDIGEGNARMRSTVFYNEIGPDYIEQAFRIARNFADNNNMKDMKLYYNDYSIDANNDKSKFARIMIKDLVDKGVPIDGIGFQMHIGPPNNIPTAKDVEDNMNYYASLGLEVLISEWDINLCGNRVTKEQQLQLYYDITKICVNQQKCVAITFWGINDQNSWLNFWNGALCNGGNSQSLLFSNDQKKDTYYRVLNALNGK